MGVHSKYGPSSYGRWRSTACPGSIRFIGSLPESERNRSSADARLGTAAHGLGEHCLRNRVQPEKLLGRWIEESGAISNRKKQPKLPGNWYLIDDEMVDAVGVYVTLVWAELARLGKGSELLIEERVFPAPSRQDVFGTSDATILGSWAELVVIDYKHGVGHVVEVPRNPQLMCYAAGSLHRVGGKADSVTLIVVQPRADHPDGPVRRWETSATELLDFTAQLELDVAATDRPDAPLRAGPWCEKHFCPGARNGCTAVRARATEAILNLVPMSIDDMGVSAVEVVSPVVPTSPDDVARALTLAHMAEWWAGEVRARAQREAERGTHIPGWKLVRRWGHRKWSGDAEERLRAAGLTDEQMYTPGVLRSPAQLEKIAGKALVADLASKPEIGAKLVPDSTPGQAAPIAIDLVGTIAD